jgi:hypothetical protein
LNSNSHGLGLNISYKIAKHLGGTIKIDSKLRKGSTFSFYISGEETKQAESGCEIIKERLPTIRKAKQRRQTKKVKDEVVETVNTSSDQMLVSDDVMSTKEQL